MPVIWIVTCMGVKAFVSFSIIGMYIYVFMMINSTLLMTFNLFLLVLNQVWISNTKMVK